MKQERRGSNRWYEDANGNAKELTHWCGRLQPVSSTKSEDLNVWTWSTDEVRKVPDNTKSA